MSVDSPTPQEVADALRGVLPRNTAVYHVELVAATDGCVARARIGVTRRTQVEISGLGGTIQTAIVDMYSRVREHVAKEPNP